MATTVTLNGVSYAIPAVGEGGYGTAVSSYLIALSTGVLAKTGGSFTLTADVDFGATYGLKATKFASRNTPATTGIFRAGNNESLAWRNAANSADLALKVNASNVLEFNGNPLVTLALGTADYVLKMNSGGTAYEWGLLTNAGVDASAAIARSKLAAGTASHVVVNDGSGNFSSEATLAKSRGGTGADNSSVTFPSTGTVVTRDASETLTNKTFDATANTLTNVSNSHVAALAGIARTKLGSGTASHVLINDVSGVMSSEATLAKSRGGTGQDNSSLTFPASGTLVEVDATQTLTEKTLTDAFLSGTTRTNDGGELRFHSATPQSYYAGFKASASSTADVDYTLPVAAPSVSGQVLSSTTAGVLSWATPFTNPMDDAGQLVYGGASGVATKLAAGTANYLLQSNGTSAPSWVTAITLGAGSTGTPAITLGTGAGLYSSGTNVLNLLTNSTSRVAISTTAVSTTLPLRVTGVGDSANGLLHLRATSGQKNYLTFTEDSVSDRWAIGTENGSGTLHFRSGDVTGTSRFSVDSAGACTIGTTGQTQTINGALVLGSGTNTHRINTATAAGAGDSLTLTNGPTGTAGNPDVYWQVNINGGVYAIPGWLLP